MPNFTTSTSRKRQAASGVCFCNSHCNPFHRRHAACKNFYRIACLCGKVLHAYPVRLLDASLVAPMSCISFVKSQGQLRPLASGLLLKNPVESFSTGTPTE